MSDMENEQLSADEEKAMVGILYNHLVFATTMEMFGELGDGGVTRIENLRALLSKLFRKYDLAVALPRETFLLLGLTDFLKMEDLTEWSKLEGNKHMQNRAKFFITKLNGENK
jgi:hypothetical protein